MASISLFVDADRPMGTVEVNDIPQLVPRVTVQFYVGRDSVTLFFDNAAAAESFHAKLGFALQDYRVRDGDVPDEPPADCPFGSEQSHDTPAVSP